MSIKSRSIDPASTKSHIIKPKPIQIKSVKPKPVQITCEEIGNKVKCKSCLKYYSDERSLWAHLYYKRCTVLKDEERNRNIAQEVANILLHQQAQQLKDLVSDEVDRKISMKSPSVHNQNLNVMCLGLQDNLLDILTKQITLPLALTFVKNSALGKLSGDIRILQKVYLPDDKRPAIMYHNKSKTQFVYYNENNDRVVETNMATMAKKLADILQRTYLKGMQSFKIDLCGEDREDQLPIAPQSSLMPTVEPYDLDTWNAHIHDLRDEKYQKKILRSMGIPTEEEVLETIRIREAVKKSV